MARRLADDYGMAFPDHLRALFSGGETVRRGCCLQGDRLVWMRELDHRDVCGLNDIRLRGWHNVLNVLAACAIAGEAGADVDAMRQAATSFAGVSHRLELVLEREGVAYVNDSIATSPERSMAALRSYAEPIILLAGGRDKHLPWAEWADLAAQRARAVILFGEAAGLIEEALRGAFERAGADARLTPAGVYRVRTLDEAVPLAVLHARSGDVVLLSPGGTSFDGFVDFAQRGERFRQLVRGLAAGQEMRL
jgi:UDP-N-acetylmuramoylalanine--D-glutamate ligase